MPRLRPPFAARSPLALLGAFALCGAAACSQEVASSPASGATSSSPTTPTSSGAGGVAAGGGGGAGASSAGGGGADGVGAVTCTPVGSNSAGDGFFSLASFGDHLYAGQFGYGLSGQSMLLEFPGGAATSPGLTGITESVCALHEHGGWLYANTESDGDIFRSQDGEQWTRVYDGPSGFIGCGLANHDGVMYAVQYGFQTDDRGRVLRSEDGENWSVVWDSGDASIYLREIVSHGGALHAFAVDRTTGQGKRVGSVDGLAWTVDDVPARFFRTLSEPGTLWLGGASYGGQGTAGVWRYDGTDFAQVATAPDYTHVTEMARWEGELWAGTSTGWKEATGKAGLLRSTDGNDWEVACEFDEAAAWSLETHQGQLYVATWQYGVGGKLYAVTPSEEAPEPPAPGEPVDCGPIAANPDWEVCETTTTSCAGVFTDGAGCTAFCAAAGLTCTARYGGEPACQKEAQNPLPCDADNGHQSDWCECGEPGEPAPPPTCTTDPQNPTVMREQGYAQAVYTKRHNWVLDCYPYAYTAGNAAEHGPCDAMFAPDGSRTGTATFTFSGVAPGAYDVYVGGRHTLNRNPAGARFIVDGVAKQIDQVDASGAYAWDLHGRHCLDGDVVVVLDSDVNSGSDSVIGVRLVPAP